MKTRQYRKITPVALVILFLPALVAAACVPPAPGLVSWWDADQLTYPDVNDTQGPNNGVFVNGTMVDQGLVGQAFRFDGIDDYILIDDDPTLDIVSSLTVDAWIYPESESLTDVKSIVTKEGPDIRGQITGIVLNLFDGKPELAVETERQFVVCRATSPVLANQYSHVAGTYDGQRVRIFVNGTLANSCPITGLMTITHRSLSIGARASSQSRYYKGLIDEVDIFNRALSDTEIQAIYDAADLGKCKNIRSKYISHAVIEDINDNGTEEVVVLREIKNGHPQVIIKDSATDTYISSLAFHDRQWRPIDLSVSDVDGDNQEDIVVLAQHRVYGYIRVDSKNAKTGRYIRALAYLSPAYEAVSIAASGDGNLNGVVDVGVMGRPLNNSSARPLVVDARDPLTGEAVSRVRYWAQ